MPYLNNHWEPNMAESEAIDRVVLGGLLESLGGDREFLGELLEAYFANAPELLGRMHAGLAAGNAGEFRQAAHSLKSTSANFGAMGLSGLCRELEDLGKAGQLDGAVERLGLAEVEYARVRAALDAIVR
jgi:HPt (histidine-containing phosphotransfer) domain-containing protein